jgi:RraA family protein
MYDGAGGGLGKARPFVLDRLNAVEGLRRFDGYRKCVVGPALTVKTREGDNLAVLHAISIARAGDILVIDGGGWTRRALVGDLARAFAISRGVLGFVVDGALRDVDTFRSAEPFACFARGTSLAGPFKDGPGRVNVPVAIGGQVVAPGDIVVADNDGIVTFAASKIDAIAAAAHARLAAEDVIRQEIDAFAGDQPWLKAIMANAGSKIS